MEPECHDPLRRVSTEREPIRMSSALSVNVFTAPEKARVGERARPFGPPMAFDPITSTLSTGSSSKWLS